MTSEIEKLTGLTHEEFQCLSKSELDKLVEKYGVDIMGFIGNEGESE